MIVLGIDQSLRATGLCIADGKSIEFEVISSKANKEDVFEKFKTSKHIADRIIKICETHQIEKIHIEGLAFGGNANNSNRDLAGLQYVIVTHILDHYPDMPIKIITPTSVKKYATGKGNSPKDELFNCLPEHIKDILMGYPKTKGRLDLCDAYWIANFEDNK